MRSFCSYCRGNTTEDFYGNCSACGAPKSVAQTLVGVEQQEIGDGTASWFSPSGSYYGREEFQIIYGNMVLDSLHRQQNVFLDYMPEPQKKHTITEFVRSLLRR